MPLLRTIVSLSSAITTTGFANAVDIFLRDTFREILRGHVIAQMNRLLDRGHKVVVPKVSTPDFDWAEFGPGLNETYQLETTKYILYGRRP
jgi:hypothetical protein